MTAEEILSIVRDELREVLRVKPEKLAAAAQLFRDLGAESIDILDLRFRLERAFGIRITDSEILDSLGEGLSAEEIDRQLTVGRIVEFVTQKLATR